MATTIDRLFVPDSSGDVQEYPFTLPANSTLNGLTVTSTLTASNVNVTGTITANTANLSVVNVAGGGFSINYYDGQVVNIFNSDYTYVADAGIGTYQGGSFEVYGDEDLYLRKSSYTYSLPNKSGKLKLGEDRFFQVDNGDTYNYSLLSLYRVIITLVNYDDSGHADLTIEGDGTQKFHIDIDLTNVDGVILEIFKFKALYYVRATYQQDNQGNPEITQTLGIIRSSLNFKFEGVSSSDNCRFRVEEFY